MLGVKVSLIPRPAPRTHMCYVKGRNMVERVELNVGALGLRTARRAKVPGSLTHVCLASLSHHLTWGTRLTWMLQKLS